MAPLVGRRVRPTAMPRSPVDDQHRSGRHLGGYVVDLLVLARLVVHEVGARNHSCGPVGVGEIGETRAQLEAGQIRLLATFNRTRMPAFPNVPTIQEYGYDVVMEKFRGLAGPKGLSPEIIAIWNEAAERLLADPEYAAAYGQQNLFANYIAHDEYAGFVAEFAAETEDFLRDAGVVQ